MVLSKGQVISKRFLGSSNSSKKRTKEFVFITVRIVFVRFLEEIDDLQKPFRNKLTFKASIIILIYASPVGQLEHCTHVWCPLCLRPSIVVHTIKYSTEFLLSWFQLHPLSILIDLFDRLVISNSSFDSSHLFYYPTINHERVTNWLCRISKVPNISKSAPLWQLKWLIN